MQHHVSASARPGDYEDSEASPRRRPRKKSLSLDSLWAGKTGQGGTASLHLQPLAHVLYQVGGSLSVHELLIRIHAALAARRVGELLGREVPFRVVIALARSAAGATAGSHRLPSRPPLVLLLLCAAG